MDDNTKKEEFSHAYVKLLASVSGFIVTNASRALDNAGIDITIRAPGIIEEIFSPSIDAQVKCTAKDIIKETFIKYPLPVNNYRRLIGKSAVSQILIIVVVPKDMSNVINIVQNETLVKSCAYWISLKGRQDTTNNETITIEIQKDNVLTSQVLKNQIENEAKRKMRLLDLEDLI
ncbi:DUF4365 domain-containing protein [Scytonema sp. NUACC26]|uniref:DUF4365 domain-containing protein n=1 Tax=Scytonema sp. NUACC26 TaxID=3140176 RepID=UPI0034DCBB80